jgi:hypothetical protein
MATIRRATARSEFVPSVLSRDARRPSDLRRVFALAPDCVAIAHLRSVAQTRIGMST